ncbi:hypothetical protein DFH06DRAFT_1246495 [Mycena polygramma]|nr:hypothetical protein DFH06DRAFT_1246495 [Mycena polygramma]
MSTAAVRKGRKTHSAPDTDLIYLEGFGQDLGGLPERRVLFYRYEKDAPTDGLAHNGLIIRPDIQDGREIGCFPRYRHDGRRSFTVNAAYFDGNNFPAGWKIGPVAVHAGIPTMDWQSLTNSIDFRPVLISAEATHREFHGTKFQWKVKADEREYNVCIDIHGIQSITNTIPLNDVALVKRVECVNSETEKVWSPAVRKDAEPKLMDLVVISLANYAGTVFGAALIALSAPFALPSLEARRKCTKLLPNDEPCDCPGFSGISLPCAHCPHRSIDHKHACFSKDCTCSDFEFGGTDEELNTANDDAVCKRCTHIAEVHHRNPQAGW